MSQVIPIKGWVNLPGKELGGGGPLKFRWGIDKKDSLQIVDLQRFASLI